MTGASPPPPLYTSTLAKVGWVLVVMGVVDIVYMIYCITNRQSYSSSFNIFAVVAGWFLLKGNLPAAHLVRIASAFLLATCFSLVLVFPLIQPIDLTLTQLRLEPWPALLGIGFAIFLLGCLVWIQRQLGSSAVLAAHIASNRKAGNVRLPVLLGVGLVAVAVFIFQLALGGESAAKAELLAKQQLGTGYRYSVTSLHFSSRFGGETHYQAQVTAWNAREVRTVPLEWTETQDD